MSCSIGKEKKAVKRLICLLLAALLLAGAIPYAIRPVTANAASVKAGDVDLDGKVSAADARLTLRSSVGLEKLSAEKTLNADADRDGKITAADARLILRKSVGLETLDSPRDSDVKMKELTGDAMKPYQSDAFRLVKLISATVGGAEHTYLDKRFAVAFATPDGYPEEKLINYVGLVYGADNKPFIVLPDATARAQGKFKFFTTHFSLLGIGELSDNQLLDTWAERAAAQGVTRRISEEELVPGLTDIIADGLNVNGLGKDQYAGAIVRSILSLDTKGEILTAAADGDMDALRAKLVNAAGEYYLGKLFRGEEDPILAKSLGDNMEAVRKNVKNGSFTAASREIADNILSNLLPMYNYSKKVGQLSDKLAEIWTDDMMNEQYEQFRQLMEKSGRVTNDEWNAIYIAMRGAALRLSDKGVTSADLRAKFEQRMNNEAKIKKEHSQLLRDAALWRSLGLMDSRHWKKSDGTYYSDIERLNALRQARDMLKSLLTVNGKFQRGAGYQTDNDFLKAALIQWIECGPNDRASFYRWLRSQGVFLPKDEPTEPTTPGGSDKNLETYDTTPRSGN